MTTAEVLAQIDKQLVTALARRSLVGHHSVEGKGLTKEIEYLKSWRLDLVARVGEKIA